MGFVNMSKMHFKHNNADDKMWWMTVKTELETAGADKNSSGCARVKLG